MFYNGNKMISIVWDKKNSAFWVLVVLKYFRVMNFIGNVKL